MSSTGLATNSYYNHRGLVIETSNPGGLVDKSQYDGAGRHIEAYKERKGVRLGFIDQAAREMLLFGDGATNSLL